MDAVDPAHQLHLRCEHLADRYPGAAEALRFYARVGRFTGSVQELLALVRAAGPPPLHLEADALAGAAERYLSGEDRTSPASFYARILLRQQPCHNHVPQHGVLRAEGDGTALHLACAICLAEWPHPRNQCPACGSASIEVFSAPELPHIQSHACQDCRRYLHVISRAVDPHAVPDADEIAALPLDVWLREQGYAKLQPNLIGI
ncbi:MAG: formate dehydrogenase accessory protein FdhE [Acidobacteria bacterium]|nr:formate dehydrogenase accessory protein FdhE [Acidobacteriota bacterium]